ncbi:fungal transcriptional regulatory-like protein [Chaetomium fimeti]|uniref:Fungal transcriptional regulatory-like protein n=1 Tax=Chaetomium fimeti TaxID=1854472 RepID=A0AAE0HB41_9PEZI|nr:fungal transcriptional regulatory-like protein [Chaetomium fimeti]
MASVEPPPNAGSLEESKQDPSPTSGDKGDQPSQPPKKATVRKRTKTGCLTCRRRRIKCDEGKPTCNNCVKSKRDCEGYSQRLTFKEPLGSFPGSHLYGHPVYHRQVQQQLVNAQISAAQTKSASSQGSLAVIAPKPPPVDFSTPAPFPLGQEYGGPSNAGGPSFDQAQRLPSPPFLGPDSNLFPDHLAQPTHGDLAAHGQFFEYTPAPVQGFQHPPGEADVAPAYTGHHPPVSGPEQSLASPESGGERLNQPLSTEEEYWDSDDEASMPESDDEVPPNPHLFHLESNDLGIQVARRLEPQQDLYGVRVRSFGGLIDENILDTYTPSSASSPLNDSQTATVFWYFVNVTGQVMSLYERHPFDPTPMFRGHPVPKQRQQIWTYTFPIMAFNHPALMQAMLALGSLQIAKLQGTPPTAAMKHYHLSLRRTAKNYQSFHRRTQPATLAATLLLGFYEVWNSDHDKWCKHMWGARAIIRDIPLRQLTREVLAYKRRQKEEMLRNHQCNEICFAAHGDLSVDSGAVDTDLISQITGQKVDYDIAEGHVIGGSSRPSRLTERDVETYEQIRDLYWWYCKMDVYQSFLGGTRPLMEYHQWTQCAPRGPFGRIDAIYGSFDFSLLLLGRVADFASRDLARKRKARKAQGPGPGQGPPGMGPPGGPPPGQGPGVGRGQSPPSFPGLMPTSGRVTIPRGFTPPRESSPPSDSAENIDLDASTADAMREWGEIRQAFDIFHARFGPDFEPLGPDVVPPEMTPFGPALTYRTYSIAGIWMTYYMGLIVLHRAHPSMPPVAVIAAGMAAPQTGKWANEIARICAGLQEDATHVTSASTLVGAAFIESCFPLFVAGVQFRDLHQRHWAIRRLRDVARLTGWQSARQIADGCESGWHKAAEMGRGPPYHSPPELGPLFPDSVWDRPRRIDRRIQELGEDGRLVLAKSEQTHYALGLLGVERDFDTLGIDDEGAAGEFKGVGSEGEEGLGEEEGGDMGGW